MPNPQIKYFPVTGWEHFPRTLKPESQSFCPEISFVDDYEDIRPGGIHHAIDIFANEGSLVISPVSGYAYPNKQLGDTDTEWKYFERGGYHCYVMGDDGILYYFAHLLSEPLVKPWQQVRAGQILGQVGRSGVVYGCPHLHFATYYTSEAGTKLGPLNPYRYLKQAPILAYNDAISYTSRRARESGMNLRYARTAETEAPVLMMTKIIPQPERTFAFSVAGIAIAASIISTSISIIYGLKNSSFISYLSYGYESYI